MGCTTFTGADDNDADEDDGTAIADEDAVADAEDSSIELDVSARKRVEAYTSLTSLMQSGSCPCSVMTVSRKCSMASESAAMMVPLPPLKPLELELLSDMMGVVSLRYEDKGDADAESMFRLGKIV